MNKSRFVGVFVTALLIGGAWLYWRAERPASAGRSEVAGGPAAGGTAHRGGQLVGSMRADPRTFNRFVARDQNSELISLLTQSRLVRINKATFDLEPRLAEKWESTPDGRTHTLHLRQGVAWSDGAPFTAADVLFSFQAVFDPKVESVIAAGLTIGGKPIAAAAPDDHTVVLTYPMPSGPGLRLLDGLPILPKHKLEAALKAGTLAKAWGTSTEPAEIVGTGPFVLREYQPGQRIVFDRNPHYWRKAGDGTQLPYLDRLVLEILPDQNTELLRLQAKAIDITQDALRPEDFVAARRAEQQGVLKMVEFGVATDADAFWFCLKPEVKQKDPRFAFVQKREFRQALSHAVDREAFVRDVYLGEGVPVWGPVTPGNKVWFSPNITRYPPDIQKAKDLLKSIGLEDRNGNGIVEDAKGTEARFAVITQRGLSSYERGLTVLRERAAEAGVALDVVPLEFNAMVAKLLACDYDAIYMRPIMSDLDPAGNLDFWLSSGDAHIWNIAEKTPATDWEKQIDALMHEQASSVDDGKRHQLFEQVQKILSDNVPALYFAAPRTYGAYTARVKNVVPSVLRPNILWNADLLAVE